MRKRAFCTPSSPFFPFLISEWIQMNEQMDGNCRVECRGMKMRKTVNRYHHFLNSVLCLLYRTRIVGPGRLREWMEKQKKITTISFIEIAKWLKSFIFLDGKHSWNEKNVVPEKGSGNKGKCTHTYLSSERGKKLITIPFS